MTRLRIHHDEQDGAVLVRASDPIWPWFVAGFCSVALIALMFTGALYFAGLARNAPSSTPTIEERRP